MMSNVVKLKTVPTLKRRREHLTNEAIEAARLQLGERIYDDDVGGFYVQGLKDGAVFRVMCDPSKRARLANGWPKTLERTVGRWPQTSAGKARGEAQRFVGMIKNGIDPSEPERDSGDESPTLAKAFDAYIASLEKRLVANDPKRQIQPATISFYQKSFARLNKKIVRLPLSTLGARRSLLREAHDDITRNRGKVAADHTIITVRAVYNHARGALDNPAELPENPVRKGFEFNRIPDRSEHGMGLDDLKPWWTEVRKLRNPVKQQLLLFMLLTGLRSKDARTAKHEHLDEKEKTLFIPLPKGGAKRAFTLPLSDAAMACISTAKAAWQAAGHPPSDYLFPSAYTKGYFDSPRVERRLDGERDRTLATGHRLRHSFATVAEACGFVEEQYGVLLNHKATTVTGRYPNRAKNVERYRAMASEIAVAIMEAIQQ